MKLKKGIKIILVSAIIISILGVAGYLVLFSPSKLNIETGGTIGLKLIADGFVSPVDIKFPEDNSGRLFIVDRPGRIKLINSDGTMQEEPFLNITDRVVSLNPTYDERGLLGLAFHPDFKKNGKFYVYYNTKLRNSAPQDWDSTIRLSEFTVSSNANRADLNSEKILLESDRPYMNHDGGQILFGKDGYLYISVGDGGNANDVGKGHNVTIGNGQDTFSLMGKILRIDVDSSSDGKKYGIPKDNPFYDGKEGLKEIYAYGFRNPWRMSFDSETGELFVGDAGQNIWEEISKVEKGKNYGWNLREGTHCFDPNSADKSPETCQAAGYKGEPLINPIIEYLNAQQKGGLGHTNVGGFMYRGKSIPDWKGKFIFGDWSASFTNAEGTLFIAEPSSVGLWPIKEVKIAGRKNERIGEFMLALGSDSEKELYVATTEKAGPDGNTGKVYKLISA